MVLVLPREWWPSLTAWLCACGLVEVPLGLVGCGDLGFRNSGWRILLPDSFPWGPHAWITLQGLCLCVTCDTP